MSGQDVRVGKKCQKRTFGIPRRAQGRVPKGSAHQVASQPSCHGTGGIYGLGFGSSPRRGNAPTDLAHLLLADQIPIWLLTNSQQPSHSVLGLFSLTRRRRVAGVAAVGVAGAAAAAAVAAAVGAAAVSGASLPPNKWG